MVDVARRGGRGRAWAAALGTLLASSCFAGCSDSGNPDPTGSGGGGGTDGGSVDAAGERGGSISDATGSQWKPVAVAGTLCRDGTPTGYGINVHPTSRKLLIFMEGGGACFNSISCLQNPESWPPTDASVASSIARNWILSRSSENSPFKDWNLTFIPYCSGDVHTGVAMSGYLGQPQVGFLNYQKDLADIMRRFPDVDQVVLAGSSAGGFGVAWNWMYTQETFGSVPVTALDDSGPPMGPEYLSDCQQRRYGEIWGWAHNLHPSCTDCDVTAGRVVRPLMEVTFERITRTRFGLLSYDEDGTIKNFFAYGNDDCAAWDSEQPPVYQPGRFRAGLAELRQAWSGYSQVAMYVVPGGSHTFLGSDIGSVKTGPAIPMLEWINRLIDQSDGWTNVAP